MIAAAQCCANDSIHILQQNKMHLEWELGDNGRWKKKSILNNGNHFQVSVEKIDNGDKLASDNVSSLI